MKSAMFTVAVALILGASRASAQDQATAAMTQNGIGNLSYVEQYQVTSESQVTVTQTGNYNMVGDPGSRTGGILQRDTNRMRINVNQLGENNQLTFSQVRGDFDLVTINQSGAGNIATVRQDGMYESGVRIEQSGERNLIDAGGTQSLAFGFSASQTGAGNVIGLKRSDSGFGGPAVTQEGYGNRATINQHNGAYSFVDIRQAGTDNQATAIRLDTLFGLSLIHI